MSLKIKSLKLGDFYSFAFNLIEKFVIHTSNAH